MITPKEDPMKVLSIAFLIACSCVSFVVSAQTPTANLTGTVTDDAGAALPGSTILVVNINIGFLRTDITDEEGRYRFSSLPFGTYDVTAQIQGFASEVQKNIPLDVGRTVSVDFHLKLSAAGEKIDIRALSSE